MRYDSTQHWMSPAELLHVTSRKVSIFVDKLLWRIHMNIFRSSSNIFMPSANVFGPSNNVFRPSSSILNQSAIRKQ